MEKSLAYCILLLLPLFIIVFADSSCRLQYLESVPDSVLRCTRLVHLNLRSNQLSGRVPNKVLKKLRYLRTLDFSNNDFSEDSRLPKRNTFKSEGSRLRKLMQDTSESTPPANSESGSSSNKWYTDWKKLTPILGGVGLLVLAVFFLLKKGPKLNEEMEKMKTHGESSASLPKKDIIEDVKLKKRDSELVFFVEEHERFTLEDLLQATADIRSESFCSSMYKVILKNNMHYAVKRLKNLQVSPDEFGKTLRNVSNLKHPNILPLVGYRSTSEEKLLIYKYQSNGSLLCLLKEYMQGKKEFPWKLRLSIAARIARGLGFIHQKTEGREIIPHGNLKLSNILLNEHNEPLISEHGISKFLHPNRSFFFSSHAYTAPENSLTEKSDVYSFGVILLELLTGKSIEINNIDLPRWAQFMVREEWTGELFDKVVKETEYEWAFPTLNIALSCVSRLPRDRPTMEEVLERIEKIMQEYEHIEMMPDEHGLTCYNNGSQQVCCSLHNIIPETWDSPGSNY
ncbi:probably inactive receptor-like protein kinase At5g41680 [Neltuma alba]|uniref:probably inactive receptor-like protein kinase At5g41680 n=1 Tax=Neltuma alba TaxID=207710 RepID=UPI0010A3B8C2|nr:probably inactive receptor-like protein kinase At5g41680 [Prosopis alba]